MAGVDELAPCARTARLGPAGGARSLSLGSKPTVPLPLPLQVDEFSRVAARFAALLSLLGSGVVGSGRVEGVPDDYGGRPGCFVGDRPSLPMCSARDGIMSLRAGVP